MDGSDIVPPVVMESSVGEITMMDDEDDDEVTMVTGLVKELEVEIGMVEELLGRIEDEIEDTLAEESESEEVLLLLLLRVLFRVSLRVLLMLRRLVARLLRDVVLEDEVVKLLVEEILELVVDELPRLLVDELVLLADDALLVFAVEELELGVEGVAVVLPLELEVLEVEEVTLSVLGEAVSVLEDEELVVVSASVDEDEVDEDVVRIEVVEESVEVEVEEVEELVEMILIVGMVEDVEDVDEVEDDESECTKQVERHKFAIDTAIASGVKHIFYGSLGFAGSAKSRKSVAHVMKAHLDTERYLRDCRKEHPGFDYTIVREGLYTESYPLYTSFFDPARPVNEIKIPHDGGGPGIAWVKREELGEATAELISRYVADPDGFPYCHETILFSGIKTLTLSETVGILSEIAKVPVAIKQVSDDQFASQAQVIPNFTYHGIDYSKPWASSFEAFRRSEAAAASPLLSELLGREPEDFKTTVINSCKY
ncbi:hypothetical protein SGCOL_005036 [Colletotrichum sp. CLE4]